MLQPPSELCFIKKSLILVLTVRHIPNSRFDWWNELCEFYPWYYYATNIHTSESWWSDPQTMVVGLWCWIFWVVGRRTPDLLLRLEPVVFLRSFPLISVPLSPLSHYGVAHLKQHLESDWLIAGRLPPGLKFQTTTWTKFPSASASSDTLSSNIGLAPTQNQ